MSPGRAFLLLAAVVFSSYERGTILRPAEATGALFFEGGASTKAAGGRVGQSVGDAECSIASEESRGAFDGDVGRALST